MVKETTIRFSLNEIREVRIVCVGCQSGITRSLSQAAGLPTHFPSCGKFWWSDEDKHPGVEATMEALRLLTTIARPMQFAEPMPVLLQFEIDAE